MIEGMMRVLELNRGVHAHDFGIITKVVIRAKDKGVEATLFERLHQYYEKLVAEMKKKVGFDWYCVWFNGISL